MAKTKLIDGYPFLQFNQPKYEAEDMVRRSRNFFQQMNQRRSVRNFSDKPVPREVIENCIRTASSAPSGAHKQPWTFCVVSNPEIKKQIRIEAEKEEYESYHGRMPAAWLKDLLPLQTDWHKDFLETAPWLIIVFKKTFEFKPDGSKGNVYYAGESCGIACGFLLAAFHLAGLAALTHTPSPMNFLSKVLRRPENEKPFLLIPVGYPASECWVPDLKRKELEEVTVWY
jgi:nitroreductase